MKKLTIYSSCIACLITIGMLKSASAYYVWSCDGEIYGGVRGNHTYKLNRYSIPESSTREADVYAAMDAWDDLVGMVDRFQYRASGSSSPTIHHDDDNWDIYFDEQEDIDGALGVTYLTIRPCAWPYTSGVTDGSLADAADVAIASDYPYWDIGNLDSCAQQGLLPRSYTIEHELGHVLGGRHETTEPSLMTPTAGGYDFFTYCGSDDPVAPLPDDAELGYDWHGSSSESYDVAPSAYYMDSTGNFNPTTAIGTLQLCKGSGFTVAWSVSNRGTLDFSNITTKIVLSTNTTITNSDLTVETYDTSRGATTMGVNNKWVTVPSTVSYNTTYYIGVITDADNEISESNEDNNATYLHRKIKIKTQAECTVPVP